MLYASHILNEIKSKAQRKQKQQKKTRENNSSINYYNKRLIVLRFFVGHSDLKLKIKKFKTQKIIMKARTKQRNSQKIDNFWVEKSHHNFDGGFKDWKKGIGRFNSKTIMNKCFV